MMAGGEARPASTEACAAGTEAGPTKAFLHRQDACATRDEGTAGGGGST